MKKSALIIKAVIASAVTMLLAACQDEPLKPSTPEGEPTKFNLEINVPVPEEIVMTKATDFQETHINEIALLFYKGENSRPIVIEQNTLSLKQEVSSTNYIYTVTCEDEEVTSGFWYLYAIANYNATDFGTVNLSEIRTKTKAEMDAYIVNQANARLDMIDNGLLMAGRYGDTGAVTLEPGENDLTGTGKRIHLRRMTAKVKVKVEAGAGVSFKAEKLTIHNYSQSSTLFERRAWTKADGAEDYKEGTFPGSMEYLGSGKFTDVDANFGADGSVTFYMMENVQKAKNIFPSDSYNYREAKSADCVSTLTDSFYYAPEKGTYVTITGYYNGPGAKKDASDNWVADPENTVSGEVTYTIHLGNFSTSGDNIGSQDNFAVRRNTKYSYKIVVAGTKNIIVEATTDTENNTGANGNLISDKKGSTNIVLDAHYETVQVAIPAQKYTEYVIRSNTPYDNNVTYRVYTDGTETENPKDVSWIKFAKSPNATTVATYPATADQGTKLFDVYQLMDELKKEPSLTSDYYFYDADAKVFYVTAFVNEYYYEGKPLKDFVNAENRELTIVAGLTESTDRQSSYAAENLFSIKQRPIVSVYDLSVTNPMGVETIEEINSSGNNGACSWGGNDSTPSMNEGWSNTNQILDAKSTSWSQYFTLNKLAHFNNSEEITVSSAGKNGAFQCLSRNRDENGDGVIDDNEIKWYLPSHDECLRLWTGYPCLSELARMNSSQLYFTSTSGNSRTWWVWEGSAFGKNESKAENVRCVRALKSYNTPTTATSTLQADGQTIQMSAMGNGAFRENGKRGEYTPHYKNDSPDQLPHSFVVARNYLTFNAGEVNAINPARVASAGYNNEDKLNIKLANYLNLSSNGYTVHYSVNGGAAQIANNELIKGIDPALISWSSNTDGSESAAVSIFASKQISGLTYTSEESTVVFTRSATEQSGDYQYSVFSQAGSAVSYSNNAYPVISHCRHDRNNKSIYFGIGNLANMSSFSYHLDIAKGSSVLYGAQYPRIVSAEVSGGTQVFVRLAANSSQLSTTNNRFFYKIGNKSQIAIPPYDDCFTATIEDSDWKKDNITITIYSTQSGYNVAEYKTTITLTRTTSHPYYSVQQYDGNWSDPTEIVANDEITVMYTDDMFVENRVMVKVFAKEFNSEAYTSYVVLNRYNSEFSYEGDYSNGHTKTVETNIVEHGPADFTVADVTESSCCEQYYYENEDKSDLGLWRIPNEKEFGVMFSHFPDLEVGTAARSTYAREGIISMPYFISSNNFITTGTNGFKGITVNADTKVFRIRCVRDGN
ncbi:MAG: hypothetical protein MJZ07_08320 [Bacteroidales bacterium]|nr:hypothetical protein [Bacteroidales bacterium]